ncbi:hypothetical protein [Microbulbifer taiwanensis]|uniref:hypothetical protein n=1 Tax=Microbulbifer taiwanensis TaxID=986746 RepID=UPI00360E4990
MLSEPGTEGQPFNRTAFFNCNTVNQQYEYFSIDSRAPHTNDDRKKARSGHSQETAASFSPLNMFAAGNGNRAETTLLV